MSFLEVFQYTRKKTPVHNLDPRSKMLFSITLAIVSLMFLNVTLLLLVLGILLPILAISESLQRWSTSMRGLLPLILFVVIFNTLFSTLERPFSHSIALAVRLVVLMTSFSLFFLTVHPDELSQALIQMGVGFEFAFAMSMSMRYVPTLGQEAYAIMDAQRARGVELDKGNLLTRIRNIVPIIVPLIIVSIRRALSVAESMESRGFGASKNRTYIYELSFRRRDWVLSIISLLSLIVMVFVRLYVPLSDWLLLLIPF